MKASQYTGKGNIAYRDVPVQKPAKGEVCIRVAYCGICGTDLHIFHGNMDQRVHTPLAIGHEMSGWIDSIGDGVSEWKVGDPVTVRPTDNCGECNTCKAGFTHICEHLKFLGIETAGAFAEYWMVPARLVHRLPAGMPMDLAALVEPLAVACHDIRLSAAKPGDFAVVSGGGPIGMLVAMVARNAGVRVVVTEINDYRLKFAESLGFETLNPLKCDAVAEVLKLSGGSGADVFFEVSGSKPGALNMTAMTRPRGQIVIVAIFPQPVPVDLHKFFWKELKLCGARVYEKEDFERAIELAKSGTLPLEKLITKRFPLNELQQAFEYIETSGNAMKILIQCEKDA